jgi:hypothetical protein
MVSIPEAFVAVFMEAGSMAVVGTVVVAADTVELVHRFRETNRL